MTVLKLNISFFNTFYLRKQYTLLLHDPTYDLKQCVLSKNNPDITENYGIFDNDT